MMSTTHASSTDPAAVPPTLLARPLRTLNNINSAPHVIQLHPNNSPKLSGKRKTAVELLEESKAFYVKTERILDRKQELPHYSPGDRLLLLQHHPNRSPMLSLPSARIREHHHVFPAVTAAMTTILPHHQFHLQQENTANSEPIGAYLNGSGPSRTREGYYTTPPVEKRRLSIRKDNPLPLNVTAVKRFLSRPGSTEENLQVRKMVPSKSTCRLIGFFEASAGKTGTLTSSSSGGGGGSGGLSPNGGVSNKKMRTRITFSEVLPCICQSNQPPELPHRMNRNNPSPPPPIPPKSPALNAKLRLLSQEQSLHHITPSGRVNSFSAASSQKPPRQPQSSTLPPQSAVVAVMKSQAATFRRIQSEEAPTSMTILPVSESVQTQRNLLLRNPILHKSLPDLNSPKNAKRGRGGGVRGGKIRSASTDLESCSDGESGGSSRMSRSSSVHLDSGSNSSDESSNESETPFSRPDAGGRGSVGASRSERATTSDYASRSPSFKYETTSLVQTSQTWTLPPPWQDDSGVDPSAAESSTVELPAPDQVRRKAILRSKSDVGPSRFAPDLLPAVPPEFTGDVPLDLDQFFDTIGQHGKLSTVDVMIDNSGRSSPVYFSSVSSVDSYCKRRHVDNLYESSDSEDMAATLQRRLLGSQPGMGEPSIVERNARIIKWLIKCRNVPVVSQASFPSSGSTGQLSKLAAASGATAAHPPPLSMLPPRSSSAHMPGKQANTQPAYYGQSTRL